MSPLAFLGGLVGCGLCVLLVWLTGVHPAPEGAVFAGGTATLAGVILAEIGLDRLEVWLIRREVRRQRRDQEGDK